MKAQINHEMIQWARKRSHFSPEMLVHSVHCKLSQLELWESGQSPPTFRQAQKLAKALHIPFGYLFLTSPPKETIPLPDLRTVETSNEIQFSPDFVDNLYDVLRKQQWYRDYLKEEGASPLNFIGKFSKSDSIDAIASDIKARFGINTDMREDSANWEEFLRNLIGRLDEQGILVCRSGIVGSNTTRKLQVDEFRGFAIYDDYAPLIFLNGRDAKAAQIFTLIHELAHLWIGQSGISNVDLGTQLDKREKQIETLCNKVASEVLVPRQDFLKKWQSGKTVKSNLIRLIRHYRVSSLVILRRAFDLELLPWEVFIKYYQDEIDIFNKKKSRSISGGGDFFQL